MILGLDEGAKFIERISREPETVLIGNQRHKVERVGLEKSEEWLGPTSGSIHYLFLSPWLALNTENFSKYKNLDSWRKRKNLLNRILVGNLLSLSKSFHLVVQRKIRARTHLEDVATCFKGVSFKGFTGKVEVNFSLPPLVGIGRGVSHGYGALLQARRRVGGISLPQ